MRVRIQTSRFDQSLFGEQEFASPLQIGMSILVMDKNANTHFLKIVSMRQQGWKPDSEVAELLEHGARSFGIVLLCETDSDWQNEVREAENSAAD